MARRLRRPPACDSVGVQLLHGAWTPTIRKRVASGGPLIALWSHREDLWSGFGRIGRTFDLALVASGGPGSVFFRTIFGRFSVSIKSTNWRPMPRCFWCLFRAFDLSCHFSHEFRTICRFRAIFGPILKLFERPGRPPSSTFPGYGAICSMLLGGLLFGHVF